MKNQITLSLTTVAVLLAMASGASAYNITINDLQNPNSSHWGAAGVGRGGEDQESEPGTASGQVWDLEAFTIKNNKLTIYSGFNFLTGVTPYGIGDLFIDADGGSNWQPGTDNAINGASDNSKFKFDYVLHFTGRVGTTVSGAYDVYKLNGDASEVLLETKFKSGSNPWVYVPGRTSKAVASGTIAPVANTSWSVTLDDGSKVVGGTVKTPHYIIPVDLSFMAGEISGKTLFKITQECGNDSLIGRVSDGGATLALLGAAMSGLSMVVRRSRKS